MKFIKTLLFLLLFVSLNAVAEGRWFHKENATVPDKISHINVYDYEGEIIHSVFWFDSCLRNLFLITDKNIFTSYLDMTSAKIEFIENGISTKSIHYFLYVPLPNTITPSDYEKDELYEMMTNHLKTKGDIRLTIDIEGANNYVLILPKYEEMILE